MLLLSCVIMGCVRWP